MIDRVRIAQIGCGYWGSNLIHNVAADPESELATICDSDPVVLQRVAGKCSAVAQFGSLDEVLAQVSMDAVVIAASPDGASYCCNLCSRTYNFIMAY